MDKLNAFGNEDVVTDERLELARRIWDCFPDWYVNHDISEEHLRGLVQYLLVTRGMTTDQREILRLSVLNVFTYGHEDNAMFGMYTSIADSLNSGKRLSGDSSDDISSKLSKLIPEFKKFF